MYFELFRRTQVFDRLGSQQDLLRIGNIDLFSALSHGEFKQKAKIITFFDMRVETTNLDAMC